MPTLRCPQRRSQYQPRLRIRCRMSRLHRPNRRCMHRRPGPSCPRQKRRRVCRQYRRPAHQPPTSGPTLRSRPPHQRSRRTSPPGPHLSCMEAGHCPTPPDRSGAPHNRLRAGAPSAAARFSLQVRATACNACRRRGNCITPPVPGPPRGIAWRMSEAMNGAAARQSRRPDSRQTNLAEPHCQDGEAVA